MNKKKLAAIAVIPALGVVALAGSVFAANSTSTSPSTSAISSIAQHLKGMRGGPMKGGNTTFTADLASILGLTQADVQAKLDAGQTPTSIITGAGKTEADVMNQLKALRLTAMKTQLAADVASGKTTQAQADAKIAKATNETGTLMGGSNGHRPRNNTTMAKNLASILGLTQADVQAKLDAGQTSTSIITGAGQTQATVMAQMKALRLADEKTKLAADVASGKITQAQADARLAQEATETPGAHQGNRGNDGDADDTASTTSTQ